MNKEKTLKTPGKHSKELTGELHFTGLCLKLVPTIYTQSGLPHPHPCSIVSKNITETVLFCSVSKNVLSIRELQCKHV